MRLVGEWLVVDAQMWIHLYKRAKVCKDYGIHLISMREYGSE